MTTQGGTNHADRTLHLLQELEHEYENIMGLRTNTNHPDYESVMGLRPSSNNTYYSVEEEIAYLHERIDQIHRNQVQNRLRNSSAAKRTKEVSCQTEHKDYLCNGTTLDHNRGKSHQDLNEDGRHPNESSSSAKHKATDKSSQERLTPCHFCGGSGVDLSQFPAHKWAQGSLPFVTSSHPHRKKSTSQDNTRHISWAFIDTGQSQPQVSHIYLELSTSPLQTLDEQTKTQQQFSNTMPNEHPATDPYRPKQINLSDSDSKASCSESELELREPDYSGDTSDSSAASTESENNDYVTLKRTHFTHRYPSFGTSVEFADFEDNCNGFSDKEGEESPFATFVSKIDKSQQQQTNNPPPVANTSRTRDQKRILKPSYKQLKGRRPTPGPPSYPNGMPSDDDDHEYVDLDLRDPELQEAAVKMQAAFKGFSARKKLDLDKANKSGPQSRDISKNSPSPATEEIDIDLNDPEVEMAAVKMQAAFKGFNARKKMGLNKSSSNKPIEPKIVVRAATPLNSSTPTRNDDDDLADIDLNDPDLACAATKMQAAFKGFSARKKMKQSKTKVGKYNFCRPFGFEYVHIVYHCKKMFNLIVNVVYARSCSILYMISSWQ